VTRRYLAYGSNLCAEQMARRCPAAVPGAVVALEGWRFVINRCGVATLLPVPGARTLGLVWQLTAPCEAALDGFEGVATGDYRKVEMLVGGEPALLYLEAEESPGFPRGGYLERILAAAERLDLPAPYRAELAAWGSAVTPALVQRVMRGYRLSRVGIHGPHHWLRVLENGRRLAALTPGADPAVVELFALLHDSRRLDDGGDRGHGERAAAFVQAVAAEGLFALEAARAERLARACARHEYGEVSAEPTIGCCWDADRLELSRLNRRPRARLLSTAAALAPMMQAGAWQRGQERATVPDFDAAWGLG
jgi:uncharacterized protein